MRMLPFRFSNLLASAVMMLLASIAGGMASSCSSGSESAAQLARAESLIVHSPDSAVSLLAEIDTTALSGNQRLRHRLLSSFSALLADGAELPLLDSCAIAEGNNAFSGRLDSDEVKWLLVKAADAERKANPVRRIELLKDAEFLAGQIDDRFDLGVIYRMLSRTYSDGYNAIVAKYYAEKAVGIFRELDSPSLVRKARLDIIGAICVERDYATMLDSMLALRDDMLAHASPSQRLEFLDNLARAYDSNGRTEVALEIWNSICNDSNANSNTLAHRALAYGRINRLDSALLLIRQANALPHNATDEYLCRNVEYKIYEKLGRSASLPRIDSLRSIAENKIFDEKRLQERSMAVNIKFESAIKTAWMEVARTRQRTLIAVFCTIILAFGAVALFIILRKRNRMLRLEHERDLYRLCALQNTLFESNSRNKEMSTRISEMFRDRFTLLDGLASAFFESHDTPHEQKRIYLRVRDSINDFSSETASRQLEALVNNYSSNLMEHFRSDFPSLSKAQYRLALYLFCGFSLQSISVFTGSSLRNLYVYKSRLKSVISNGDCSRKDDYLSFFN